MSHRPSMVILKDAKQGVYCKILPCLQKKQNFKKLQECLSVPE